MRILDLKPIRSILKCLSFVFSEKMDIPAFKFIVLPNIAFGTQDARDYLRHFGFLGFSMVGKTVKIIMPGTLKKALSE
jgi:hypothetical protein